MELSAAEQETLALGLSALVDNLEIRTRNTPGIPVAEAEWIFQAIQVTKEICPLACHTLDWTERTFNKIPGKP